MWGHSLFTLIAVLTCVSAHLSVGAPSTRHVQALSAQQVINVRLCFLAEPQTLFGTALGATWVLRKNPSYIAQFGVNVSTRLIGDAATAGLSDTTRAARAIVRETPNCDAFHGVARSPIAEIGSAVNSKLWMDLASATVLSDKSAHPFFSRAIPNAKADGEVLVPLLQALGVRTVHVVCADDAYGRSVTEGFTQAAIRRGLAISTTACYLKNSAPADVVPIVQTIMSKRAESEWVVLGMYIDAFSVLDTALRSSGANATLKLISSRCQDEFSPYPGFVCVRMAINRTKVAIAHQWRATRSAAEKAEFDRQAVAAGVPPQYLPRQNFVYAASTIGADNIDFLVRAFAGYRDLHPTLSVEQYDQLALVKYMRANVTLSDGIAGFTALTETGDRTLDLVSITNTLPNGTFSVMGFFSNATGLRLAQPLFVTGHGYVSTLPVPYHQSVMESGSGGTNKLLVVVVAVCGCVVVLSLVAAVMFALCRRGNTRDLQFAPKDSTAPFAIAFTDIQASTALWARLPEHMGDALDAHHMIIRDLIAKHEGYEVKTIGDSFMVAFKTAVSAAQFAVELQAQFLSHDWQTAAIDTTYDELLEELREEALMDHHEPKGDVPLSSQQRNTTDAWNGLRVRVGVSFGLGRIDLDQVSQSYDYYGTVVNTAARVETVAHGGQVLLTGEAHEQVLNEWNTSANGDLFAAVESLGPQPLRGLPEPVPLVQYRPRAAGLASRGFPPLRLDSEKKVDAEDWLDNATADSGRVPSPRLDALQTDTSATLSGPRSLSAAAASHGGRVQDTFDLAKLVLSTAGSTRVAAPAPPSHRGSLFASTPTHTNAVTKFSGGGSSASSATPDVSARERYLQQDSASRRSAGGSDLHDAFSTTLLLMAPLKPAVRQRMIEEMIKAWRIPDPTRSRHIRNALGDSKAKRAFLLMAALHRAQETATVRTTGSTPMSALRL